MSLDPSKFIADGLTFDDVLLIPTYSEVLPRETNTQSYLTRQIKINIPIISAAMDTVTDARLAIAMAQAGGMGLIHKNMTIQQQVEEVRKVKRSESCMIQDPVTLREDAILADALNLMKKHCIGGIPVVNQENRLVGIITNRDLRFHKDKTLPITDFMSKHALITAPEGTDLAAAEIILQKYKIEKLPILTNTGKLAGLITYKDILKLKTFPLASKDQHGRLRAGAAVGMTPDSVERVASLIQSGVDIIAIDTAHGHSKGVLSLAKEVKQLFPDLQLIVGNIATKQAAQALADVGVDAVKVGIGPGSICTTRIIAGVGVPQLTAIYEVSQALKGSSICVIADGGIKQTGDIVKAIAAGADTVMAGSLFAGVEESPGKTIIYEGRTYKSYRGMGSLDAMEDGSKDRYFQDSEEDTKKLVPEGVVGRVPYKGTLINVMFQYVGGLQSGMGYCGAKTIAELQQAKFIRITAAGMRESHTHDVTLTKEAPNYSK